MPKEDKVDFHILHIIRYLANSYDAVQTGQSKPTARLAERAFALEPAAAFGNSSTALSSALYPDALRT
jgi:hypothetical protein